MSKILDFFKKKFEKKPTPPPSGVRLGSQAEYEAEKALALEKAMQALEERRLRQQQEKIQREANYSDPSLRAAHAALQRMEVKPPGRPGSGVKSTSYVSTEQYRERKEMENAEALAARFAPPKVVHIDKPSAIDQVLFTCIELFGADFPPLPKADLLQQIIEYCRDTILKEPSTADYSAVLLLHTCNPTVKVKKCVETLSTILKNARDNPTEEKYRKLRLENKRLTEEVFSLEGAVDFLKAVGFHEVGIARPLKASEEEDDTEQVLVLPLDVSAEVLEDRLNVLLIGQAIPLALYRDTRVFQLTGQISLEKVDLPPEFYAISEEEMKREYAKQQQIREETGMLLTKAMRERMEQKELRRYNYCLVRVRFPDNTMLQGTFEAREPIQKLMEWITEYLHYPHLPFQLNSFSCRRIHEQTGSFTELKLAPMAVINFSQMTLDNNAPVSPPYLAPSCFSHVTTL